MTAAWTDDQLVEFALGTLPDDESASLEQALAGDAALRGQLAEVQDMLASFADAHVGSAPVRQSGLSRLMEATQQISRFTPMIPLVCELLGVSKEDALGWLDGLDEPSKWQPGVLPDTHMQTVPTDDPDLSVVWLRMPPGMAFPEHEHLGDETVLVVQGRYIDDAGTLHPPGSVLREEPDTHHAFHIDASGPPFICLALVRKGLRIGGEELTREALYGAAGG